MYFAFYSATVKNTGRVAVGVRGFTGETKYEFRRLNAKRASLTPLMANEYDFLFSQWVSFLVHREVAFLFQPLNILKRKPFWKRKRESKI